MNNAVKNSRNLHVFLVGLCLVFVLIIVLDMNRDYALTVVDKSESQIIAGSEQTITDTVLVSVKLLDEYDQIIERPLFMQNRRPYLAEKVVDASQRKRRKRSASSTKLDEYMLSAIIITGDKQIALLQAKNYEKLQKLNRGDEIDGWTLIDIEPTQVLLKKGSEIKQLELVMKGSPQHGNAKRKNDPEQAKAKEISPPGENLAVDKPLSPETVRKEEK